MATAALSVNAGTAASARAPAHWRLRGIGVLRIIFGAVWAVDAWFKWQPTFIDSFSGYLIDAQQLDGQPALVHHWIGFWINTVNVDPHVFAHGVAIAETVVAIGLLLGLFSHVTYAVGAGLCVVIWSTAESFGGPYVPGSTDIGAAVIYVLVFAGLFLSQAGNHIGLDPWLGRRLVGLGWLGSGTLDAQP